MGIHAYAFPPISLLHLVIAKIESELSRIVLIALFWPRQPWFPRLLSLLVDKPVMLPQRPDLLSQPKSRILHPDPVPLHFCAWKLSKAVFARDFFFRGPAVTYRDIPEGDSTVRPHVDFFYTDGLFIHREDWRNAT